MKQSHQVVAVALFIAVAGAVWISLPTGPSPTEPKPTVSGEARDRGVAATRPPSVKSESADAPAGALPGDPTEVAAIATESEVPLPTPDVPTEIDPESQPRAFMKDNFQGLTAAPPGFELSNIVITPAGLTLDPNAPEKEGLREGVIISPAKPTGFPSNAFVPMWKEIAPEGTGVLVEFQVSPNGTDWSEWYLAERDEEMMQHRSSTFPDGSPNPNAEYVLGSLHAWPEEQWSEIRYRATLQSGTTDSPVIEGFQIYHMDSTLGGGRLANLPSSSTP